MEDSQDYKNGFPKVDINKDSVLKMLTKVAGFKMEERDLALDRFKRCNEEMETAEFWLQGKTAIMYLDSAAKSSNYLGDMAKDVMKLVFKEEAAAEGSSAQIGMSDEDKKRLSIVADNHIREKRKRELDQRNDMYKQSGGGPSDDDNPENDA